MDHNNYTYTYQPRQRSPSTASAKSNGAYQNSSAFSASANPDKDWTKISHMAERRRIQNRIAQRNHRKKLKRRLEDLERRTTSSSVSPKQSHRELVQTPANDLQVPASHQMQRRVSAPRAGLIDREQQRPTNIMSSGETWMAQAAKLEPAFSFPAPSTSLDGETYLQPERFGRNSTQVQYVQLSMLCRHRTYFAEPAQSMLSLFPTLPPYEIFGPQSPSTSDKLSTSFDLNNTAALKDFSGVNTKANDPSFLRSSPPI